MTFLAADQLQITLGKYKEVGGASRKHRELRGSGGN